ncbi:hypothetical protein [Arthrobacter luteolus]|uniref:hypothetical protein n=1 Tax=Arthrobacter luteolus TaxID=98672 RepID=UPI00082DD63F|nr:hypothetical protein [Arthrobacter luteolus]
MSNMTITIKHDGKTYGGQIGTIKSTSLGTEHHGVMTGMLHVEWKGGGVGVGGMTLDTPRRAEEDNHLGRFGTAYGLDHIMRVLEAVGVDKWEDLPGTPIVVLFEGQSIWGAASVGIAGITNEKVLIYKDHVDEFKDVA